VVRVRRHPRRVQYRARPREGHEPRPNPKITLAASDPDNPYRYVQVKGRIVEVTEQGADPHIDKMAKKYLDKDKYPGRKPGEQRMIVKVLPERVQGMG